MTFSTLEEAAARLAAEGCDHQAAFDQLNAECVDNSLFENLMTSYSQNKYFQNEFGLIMPEKKHH